MRPPLTIREFLEFARPRALESAPCDARRSVEEAVELAAESLLQPNVHNLALTFAAVTYALAGERTTARSLISRARATMPGYDLEDFLSVFKFQQAEDIDKIHKAFELLGTTGKAH